MQTQPEPVVRIPRPNFCGGFRCYDVAPTGESRCHRCKTREREQREDARLRREQAPAKKSRRAR